MRPPRKQLCVLRSIEEDYMRLLHTWIYKYGLLAALVLAAGAGKKWG
jgi:hypothetical protein